MGLVWHWRFACKEGGLDDNSDRVMPCGYNLISSLSYIDVVEPHTGQLYLTIHRYDFHGRYFDRLVLINTNIETAIL